MNDQVQLPENISIWGTQGGGYATWDSVRKTYVWYEVPDEFPEFKAGEPIPEMWDVIPATQAARDDDFDDSEPVFTYPSSEELALCAYPPYARAMNSRRQRRPSDG